MRNFSVALLIALASARDSPYDDILFLNYIAKFNKTYKDIEEFTLRHERFHATELEIRHFNESERSSVHSHNYISD